MSDAETSESPAPTNELDALENEAGAYVADRAVIEVSGDDTGDWLQSQLTQDLRGMGPGDSRYALFLTQKGKVRADMHVCAAGDEFFLVVPREGAQALVDELEKFIVMEDVDLELREDLHVVAIQGPGASEVAPDEGSMRFEADLIGVGGVIQMQASPDLPEGVAAVSEASVEAVRLHHGVPLFGADFGPETLPQVARVAGRAVSFDKGCYRGQEAVVMLEHRGHPPKRLVRLESAGDASWGVGADIIADDKARGAVTSVAKYRGRTIGLGYLKRAAEPEAVTAVGDAPATARLAGH